jgi:hypothetical protein
MVDPDIKTHMLRTYVALRRLMAVVTLAFLVTLSLYRLSGQDTVVRNSISAYYHHDNAGFRMKDVFVAALTAVGLLLVAYQGYTDRENWALNVAGVSLILVVAFPMDWPPGDTWRIGSDREKVHYASAVLFFLLLAYVCLYRAHDTLPFLHDERRKRLFKNLYRVTGALMLGVPFVAIGLYCLEVKSWVYAVEYAGVAVFLSYWVIKSTELRLTRLETEGKVDRVAAACAAGADPSTAV